LVIPDTCPKTKIIPEIPKTGIPVKISVKTKNPEINQYMDFRTKINKTNGKICPSIFYEEINGFSVEMPTE